MIQIRNKEVENGTNQERGDRKWYKLGTKRQKMVQIRNEEVENVS